jgi:hypothetical protein
MAHLPRLITQPVTATGTGEMVERLVLGGLRPPQEIAAYGQGDNPSKDEENERRVHRERASGGGVLLIFNDPPLG